MKAALLDALEARYEAQISESDATLKIYLEHPVGKNSRTTSSKRNRN